MTTSFKTHLQILPHPELLWVRTSTCGFGGLAQPIRTPKAEAGIRAAERDPHLCPCPAVPLAMLPTDGEAVGRCGSFQRVSPSSLRALRATEDLEEGPEGSQQLDQCQRACPGARGLALEAHTLTDGIFALWDRGEGDAPWFQVLRALGVGQAPPRAPALPQHRSRRAGFSEPLLGFRAYLPPPAPFGQPGSTAMF